MTDQATPNATDKDRSLAREWAESIKSTTNSVESTGNPWSDRALAAARVILDTVPAPPTLADMTDEERAACIRMQCDTGPNRSVRGFIAEVHPGGCRVIERDTWEWRSCSDDLVTPRPDLPRMEWPGDTPHTGPTITFTTPAPTPALPDGWRYADHEKRGRVIVTRPEPDNDGEVIIACSTPNSVTRAALVWCHQDKLTYLDTDQEDDQ